MRANLLMCVAYVTVKDGKSIKQLEFEPTDNAIASIVMSGATIGRLVRYRRVDFVLACPLELGDKVKNRGMPEGT